MIKKIIYSKNKDIHFPYAIYLPEKIAEDASLIVDILTPHPKTGNVEEMIKELEEESISYNPYMLMNQLFYPVMVPLIPRVKGFYTSFLGSSIIKNDFSLLHGNIPKEEEYRFANIDKQVYEMILEANEKLNIKNKAIIHGYSAGAKFATGFSILHPDVICCNISGGTSGLSTLPIEKLDGHFLPYPLGVADIDFHKEEFEKILHFFYIGEEDNNNPALPKCELLEEKDVNGNPLPKKDKLGRICYQYDEDGKLLPTYPECYTKEQIEIIHEIYGDENLPRFQKIKAIYEDLNVDSIHKIYKGNHLSIFKKNREEILKDMIKVIELARNKEKENLNNKTK